ncbi:MAG: pseudouridine synthase [Bacillota bacterium]|nr:pseudouridine synthase [Bacillota bacterium]
MSLTRLDKYLCDGNVGTRSKVKELLKAGRVRVNDTVVKDGSVKINTDSDKVYFDGRELTVEKLRYFMLNKPAGCVSATKDKLSDTVLDMLKGEDTRDLFPVGRLDKDTEGFLLITNDGELAHNLLSPKKHVEKKYYVRLNGQISEEAVKKVEDCIDIGDDKPCLPAKVEVLKDDEVNITITEGRYHQVKRMFQAVGLEVIYLKRISMGKLSLDETLAPGEYKKLGKEDIEQIR